MTTPVQPLYKIVEPLTTKHLQAQKAHLDDLQGNILKGHGRDHSAHVFLKFTKGKAADVKAWIRNSLKPRLTSALKQLADTEEFKKSGKDGGIFRAFFLTASGYAYLGKDPTKLDSTFQKGIKASVAKLNDPDVSQWDVGFQDEIHAMVLIADVEQANVRFLAKELAIEVAPFAEIAHVEFGDQRKNERGNGIEHFGYVDGRSQPLMLASDVNDESDGTTLWNPKAGPAQVLVPDPFGASGASGSYFVFRKLEQRVKAFKTREQDLATAMGLVGDARELAGAMVVGRFEDGTPVVLSDEPMIEVSDAPNGHSVPNNFDYRDDLDGNKCPFHAHIRKSNPRGTGPGGLADENSRRMARRGITYGKRKDDGSDIENMPDGGVGLLFMAYQTDIAKQFEFIQQRWVNDPDFPQNRGGTGIDPVIGQASGSAPAMWPKVWNGPSADKIPFDFSGFVTMKGGEYFFAPSLSALGML